MPDVAPLAMSESRRNGLALVLAMALPGVALLARLYFGDTTLGRPAMILFIIPVTLCAYLGGLLPGVLCTAFSALLTAFFLAESYRAGGAGSSFDLMQWSIFILAGAVVSYLADRMLQSQARLRADEIRLSGMFNAAMDGIITVDDQLEIVYINPAAEKMFGYAPHQLVGTAARLLIPESHRRLCEKLIRSLAVSGALNRFVEGPVRGVRANGEEFPVEATISRHDVDGEQHFTLVIRDVSERKRAENALRDSETLYRGLFESLEEGVVLWDADGRIEACNRAAERLLGWKASALVGMHYADIPWKPRAVEETAFNPETLAVAIIRRTNQPLLHRERVLKRSDGADIWIVQNGIPLSGHAQDGRPPRVIITFSDITERKKSTEALAQMAAIVAHSEDVIITKTVEGVIQTWNPGAQKLLGYTAAEAIGRKFQALLMPPQWHEAEREVRARAQDGESVNQFQTVFLSKDGRELQMSASASPLRDRQGAVTGISTIARDVTERRRAENALRESEERFRIVADTAPALIWMNDARKRGTYFNSGWLNFTGRTLDQELGSGWMAGIHPDDLATCVSTFNKGMDSRAEFQMECRLRRHDGVYRLMLTVAKPRFDGAGGFAGYIGTCVDLTDRKLAEEAMRERDAAAEASRLKSEFLATMSHELRTPLTGVIGFAEYLRAGQAGPLNEEQAECLDSVHGSSLHLLTLINDILDLSKIEAGKMELTPETFSVSEAVAEVCGVVSPIAIGKRVELQRRVAPALSSVTLDRTKFVQVLHNLVSNGVKFTPAGGRVEVEVGIVGEPQGLLVVRVSDTGIGIDGKDIERLFEKFYQIDGGDARRHEGTGLGLALTKKIVELQHGTITVESKVDQGSVFIVTLPQWVPQDAAK